ncbi:MAG: peptidase MA family metallohydrolase [Peptococcaceae bacterium]
MQILTNHKSSIFLIFIILLTLLMLSFHWNIIKLQAYTIIRSISKIDIAYVTKDFVKLESGSFVIIHKAADQESALLVAETANEVFEPVNRMLDYTGQNAIPVILYPTMEELNHSFGWEGDKSPMGVYWMGTIRVLAPEAWIDQQEDQEKVFKQMGPMAHEYAHLVVDYKTNGNYPRWFTEGVAQYVEKKLTGFTLDEPSNADKLNIYNFRKLDKEFDEQANQELAYWQSLIAVEYLVDKNGPEIINRILTELGNGKGFADAFSGVTGESFPSFVREIREYVQLNQPGI